MPVIHFTIDGKRVSCEKDSMLLDVARANGFDIPALCHHQAEPAYGACRLCLVEIRQGGSSWVETACNYPVRNQGLEVETDSDQVRRYRRLNLELLLARCPESEVVRQMAQELGVERVRLPLDGEDECILCGLCVRVCHDLIGVGAISFVGRGPRRRVDTPYGESSEVCIGCDACAEVCPTDYIKVVDDHRDLTREIQPFHTKHKLVACPECGRGYVTEKQLQYLREQLGDKDSILGGCIRCRTRKRAEELLNLSQKQLTTPIRRR